MGGGGKIPWKCKTYEISKKIGLGSPLIITRGPPPPTYPGENVWIRTLVYAKLNRDRHNIIWICPRLFFMTTQINIKNFVSMTKYTGLSTWLIKVEINFFFTDFKLILINYVILNYVSIFGAVIYCWYWVRVSIS